jgi:hypothetical protein
MSLDRSVDRHSPTTLCIGAETKAKAVSFILGFLLLAACDDNVKGRCALALGVAFLIWLRSANYSMQRRLVICLEAVRCS